MDRIAFYPPSIEDAVSRLETDLETGLSDTAAQQRLDRHGPNSIVGKRTGPWVRFLSYFRGPIPAMIEPAARQWEDFAINPARHRNPAVRRRSGTIETGVDFRGFGK